MTPSIPHKADLFILLLGFIVCDALLMCSIPFVTFGFLGRCTHTNMRPAYEDVPSNYAYQISVRLSLRLYGARIRRLNAIKNNCYLSFFFSFAFSAIGNEIMPTG